MLDSFIRNTIFLDCIKVWFKVSWKSTKENYKEELLNVQCFLNITSILGLEVVHITLTALFPYIRIVLKYF